MTIYFMDSSALVKRYVDEKGSVWIQNLFDPKLNNETFIAAITAVEVIAAIAGARRGKRISFTDATTVCNQFRHDLQVEYQIIEVTEDIIISGMALAESYELRGYDAVQLAAGYATNALCIDNGLPPAIFVSADNELNSAALRVDLTIANPNEQQ